MAKISKSGFKILDKHDLKNKGKDIVKSIPVKKENVHLGTDNSPKQSFKKANTNASENSDVGVERGVKNKTTKNNKSNSNGNKTKTNLPYSLKSFYNYLNEFKIILKIFKVEYIDKKRDNPVCKNVFAKLRFNKLNNGVIEHYFLEIIVPTLTKDILTGEHLDNEEMIYKINPIINFSILPDTNIVFRTKDELISAELMLSTKRLSPMSSLDSGFKTGRRNGVATR